MANKWHVGAFLFFSDRHHFDNPVYSFGNGAAGGLGVGAVGGGGSGGLALNNASTIRIRNDLGGKCNMTNLEKAKLDTSTDTSGDDHSEGNRIKLESIKKLIK